MLNHADFLTSKAKPLPVILILDVSGSMRWKKKIMNLNQAVEVMVGEFAKSEQMEVGILVTIIIFGTSATLYMQPTKPSAIQWKNLSAGGDTAMGAALSMAKGMIENKDIIPSRAYRPTVILISDGRPTDKWEKPLEEFIKQGRSSKCDRMAMAIGKDADEIILKRFIEGTPNQLFYAENASQLHDFFKFVTMSVTMRTRSTNPNEVPIPEKIFLDGSTIPAEKKTKRTRNSDKTPKVISDDDGYW